MKSSAKAPLYFSAYPLKAVEPQTANTPKQHQSPYLRSLLAGNKKSAGQLHVYPMANPYRDHAEPVAKRPQPPVQMLGEEKDWFKHYE